MGARCLSGSLANTSALLTNDRARTADLLGAREVGQGCSGGPGPGPFESGRCSGRPGIAAPDTSAATDDGEVRLVATLTSFATATHVTLAEMQLEAFLPADAATAERLRRRAGG